jgi:holo-[acyl-carrier protein] synthase
MISIGVDLVNLNRFKTLLTKGDFIERCFCESEIVHYHEKKRTSFLAGRYAAKEAVLKALGTGLIDGISLTDIEVIMLPSGAPSLILKNLPLLIAQKIGITNWLITISHTTTTAISIVIGQ